MRGSALCERQHSQARFVTEDTFAATKTRTAH